MKKWPTLLCLCLLLLARCTSPKGDQTATDSVAAKIDTTTVQTIKAIPKEVPDSLQNFSSEWVRLSEGENGGGYLIYEPCTAANPSISISRREDGDFISINLGQMAEQYKIISFQASSIREYEIICEGEKTVSINYLDKEEGIAQWTWQDENHNILYETRTYVEKDLAGKYPVKEEAPCEEM